MKTQQLDLYTDYLASTAGYATATGWLAMLDGDVSHDQVTRFLPETGCRLFLLAKPISFLTT